MALFDFDKLKKQVTSSADQFVKSAQENLPENLKNIDVGKSLNDMAKKSGEAINRFMGEAAKTDASADDALKNGENTNLTIKDSLKIIYYLMAVDQSIGQEEIDSFDAIGKDLDPNYEDYRDELISFCKNEIDKNDDEDEYVLHIHECISEAIRHSAAKGNGTIQEKLLLWNLYSVAFSDGSYSDIEKKLIRYTAKKMNIDKSVPVEMENIINTVTEIDKEEAYLKNSDRKYSEIEIHLNELADRKSTVLKGVNALIVE